MKQKKCESKDESIAAQLYAYSEEESSSDVGADTATAAKQPMRSIHVTVCNINIRNMFKDIPHFPNILFKTSPSFG
jgi:hypothetical protein